VSCFQGLAWRINWIGTHLQVLSELTGFYDCDQKMKGEKKHAPAWCDRIICFWEELMQQEFSRGESRLSDHRPIRAIFVAESDVSSDSRSLGSSFTGSFNFLQDLFKSALMIRYHVMSEQFYQFLSKKKHCYTWDHSNYSSGYRVISMTWTPMIILFKPAWSLFHFVCFLTYLLLLYFLYLAMLSYIYIA